ncbi:MAG: ImmA/IrrE family metallo-endopeptidase [Methanobrevibacter sp.]|nr:ImmA/IrrE family metallo-endopeptidase [Candidatus Methanovirga meridionalis]
MTYRVNVNPEMLKWARINAGFEFDDLPKSLKNVPLWEEGKIKPTWNDLRRLAKKYKRPPVFYFASSPPVDNSPEIIEFRSNEIIDKFSLDLNLELNKAKYRRNVFINLNNDYNIKLKDFSTIIHENKNVEFFSNYIRSLMNISFDSQAKWIYNINEKKDHTHSNFLYEWKEIISDLGILVFETEKVQENEMSGLSLYYDISPIILLNGKNSINRRIFTLIHELVHLLMGETTIGKVDFNNKKEAFCNKVAANVLVPSDLLKNSKLSKNVSVKSLSKDKINYRQLGTLSHMFGVSKQVILIQLYKINKISLKFKNEYLNQLKEQNNVKKIKEKEKRSFGGISPVGKVKKYVGKPFSRFIIDAYENNIIGYSSFQKYLDLDIDLLDSLHDEVYNFFR